MTGSAATADKMRIITMSEEDLAERLEWAEALPGYTIGPRNTAAFWAADPEGFLGVTVDGRLEGTLAAVRYSPTFGFSGLYHMRAAVTNGSPKTRLGVVRVLQAALERFGDRCIGTEGDDYKEGQYNRILKFRRSWVTIRHRAATDAIAALARIPVGDALVLDPSLVPAGDVPFEQLAAYDGVHFGARRDGFLRHWIADPGHQAWACVEPASGGDVVRGLAVIRPWLGGWQIGPLFADDAEIAEALFRQCIAVAAGGDLCLDTPDANPAAVALARRYGMSQSLTTTRMYRNGDPGLPATRIFGVSTLELG